jgi:hypothetical protein
MEMDFKDALRINLNNAWRGVAIALAAIGSAGQANAFEIATEPDVSIRWDNTFKYSVMQRLKDPSSALISTPTAPPPGNIAGANFDDGDRNFQKGIASNRVDWLSELDLTYKGWVGFRLSAAAWYDSVYNRSNSNTSPATINSASAPAGEFSDATRDLMGRKAELLDAFVFAQGEVAGMASSGRLGKHTVLYGESLFFGSNGIAAGQAPVDVVKLLSVPNSQFKEILLPVKQVSGQVQVSNNLTVGGYYQFNWEPTRIPPSGSYFSNFDPVGTGGEQGFLLTGAPPFLGGPVNTLTRTGDITAKNSGQGGIQVRLRPQGMDTEFGLYAIQYHDKTPQFYVYPLAAPMPPVPQSYKLVFPENIQTFGASFSTVVGAANLAGEVSVRHNTPLVSSLVLLTQAQAEVANNSDQPFYALGNSAHAQLSAIVNLSPGALWQGGVLLGEVAWNRRTSITKNADVLDLNVDRDAWGFRGVFEPAYYQVLPGLDITVPIGFGYNPKGKSSVVAAFNGGVNRGGDISIGINGDYQKVWKLSAKYTRFLGTEDVAVIPSNSPAIPLMNSFGQTLKDRDFLSLSVQYTF